MRFFALESTLNMTRKAPKRLTKCAVCGRSCTDGKSHCARHIEHCTQAASTLAFMGDYEADRVAMSKAWNSRTNLHPFNPRNLVALEMLCLAYIEPVSPASLARNLGMDFGKSKRVDIVMTRWIANQLSKLGLVELERRGARGKIMTVHTIEA